MKTFGGKLKQFRLSANLSLRDVCKKLSYDPSNWSKIERGIINPPTDEKVLEKWAKALNIEKEDKIKDFVYSAKVLQGLIPNDIINNKDLINHLPVFFRTAGKKKPNKKDIDSLINIIKRNIK